MLPVKPHSLMIHNYHGIAYLTSCISTYQDPRVWPKDCGNCRLLPLKTKGSWVLSRQKQTGLIDTGVSGSRKMQDLDLYYMAFSAKVV